MYVVAANVSYRVIDNLIIAMDIARNRYHALSGMMALTFRCIADGRTPDFPGDAQNRAKLNDAGLLESASAIKIMPQFSMPHPTNGATRINIGNEPQFIGVMQSLMILWFSRAVLRSFKLHYILKAIQTGEANTSRPNINQLIIDFKRAQAIMIFNRRCLPDSIALLWLCRKHGIRAKIVFGVKTMPFQAHCWVQVSDTVLNDTVEHASAYLPIGIV